MREAGVTFARTLLIVLMTAAPASAQTREARATIRGTAVISGTIVSDDDDPRPVRRVRVTCSGSDVSATTISDDRGRFQFPGLRAGRYTLTATKDAWISTAYGARRPLRPGSALPIADGQAAEVVIRMLRGSVITGVVLDHANQPAANTVVSAMRYVTQNGERRLVPAGLGGIADDRGVYRIYGLAPGDYVVGAATAATAFSNTPASELRLLGVRGGGEGTVSLASTFFPGTTITTQAGTVTVGRAEERTGIDFSLQLVPTARVEGTVTLPDGSPAPAGTQVNLVPAAQVGFRNASPGRLRTARVGADGGFSFGDVSPGTFTVLARATVPSAQPGRPAQLTWAASDIAVDGEPITGLSLNLQPGMTVAGQIRFDGTLLKPPAHLEAVRVSVQPAQAEGTVSFAPSPVGVDGNGRFVVAGITPGRYRLAASFPGSDRPGNWQLRSAIVNGQDTLDVPFTVQPSQSITGATITFADRAAALSGAVHNAAGGAPNEFTVVLFPTDQTHWLPRARRIHGARPSSDGAYAFRSLPAGEYYLAAINDVEPGEWFDPAFLQRLLPSAMKLVIGDGEQKVQDIRLGGPG